MQQPPGCRQEQNQPGTALTPRPPGLAPAATCWVSSVPGQAADGLPHPSAGFPLPGPSPQNGALHFTKGRNGPASPAPRPRGHNPISPLEGAHVTATVSQAQGQDGLGGLGRRQARRQAEPRRF